MLWFYGAAGFTLLGCLHSLLPTFYPFEAESRGATPTEYGIVFGIPSLFACVTSLYFGKYGSNYGVKLCLSCAAIMEGLCGILFSFLAYVTYSSLFIGLSCVNRSMVGIVQAIRQCSGFAILLSMYPVKVIW